MRRPNWIQRGLQSFAHAPRLRPAWNLFYRCINRLTKCGPVANKPGLYFLYARLFKPGDFWVLPNRNTELLIESAGAAASHAFRTYVQKHNPEVNLAYGCEVPATLKYAQRHTIPAVVLTRAREAFVSSVTERFPQITHRNAERIHATFHEQVEVCLLYTSDAADE